MEKAGSEMVEQAMQKEVRVEMVNNDDGTVTATVTTTMTENGEEMKEEQVFSGTMEEVEAKIEAMNQMDNGTKVKIKKIIEKEVEEN